jgi:hypothetical protein
MWKKLRHTVYSRHLVSIFAINKIQNGCISLYSTRIKSSACATFCTFVSTYLGLCRGRVRFQLCVGESFLSVAAPPPPTHTHTHLNCQVITFMHSFELLHSITQFKCNRCSLSENTEILLHSCCHTPNSVCSNASDSWKKNKAKAVA